MPRWIAALFVMLLLVPIADAQIVRLPSVMVGEENDPYAIPNRPRGILAGYPSELSQPLLPEGQPSAGPVLPNNTLGGGAEQFSQPADLFPPTNPNEEPPLPKGAKNGVLQQVLFAETYLPQMGSDGMGMNDLLIQSTVGFPFFTRENPLLVTPAFEAQLLQGPTATEVPPQLFDASLQFVHVRKLSKQFSIMSGIQPGWHSDFEQGDHRAFRLPGRLLGVWEWRPETQFVFGVLYLDRDDIRFLPAGGLIFGAAEDRRLELIFPRPRYTHRFIYNGEIEWWWYVAGEFGGGSYTFERTTGGTDVITLSDWRALLGIERRVSGGINSRLEFGYVFNRRIQYESGAPEFNPTATLLARCGLTY